MVPRDWNTTTVAMVFKKGRKYKASYYCPVSITCVLCKDIEHIAASQVMQHLIKHNILFNHEHGFNSELSTEMELVEFREDVLRGITDR